MICETTSTSFMRKTTCPRPLGMTIEIISLPSLATRASSLRARAGMMAVNGWTAGCDRIPLRTDRRNPSAEAMVMESFSTTTSTPISTGTGLVPRGGEDHLRDHVLEIGHVQQDGAFHVGDGQGRELLGVDALDVGVRGPAAQVQGLGGAVQVQAHLLLRQGPHQVGEGARRDGGGAFLFDLGTDPAGDAQFQVGRRQAQAAFIAGDQDVRKHRQGAARRNRP